VRKRIQNEVASECECQTRKRMGGIKFTMTAPTIACVVSVKDGSFLTRLIETARCEALMLAFDLL
jgi:hypothetical protein